LVVVIGSGFFSVHLSRAYVPSDLDFVPMEEDKAQVGRLFVDTEPTGATIKILNIKPRFYQGIELAPGKYHVAVSAAGYQTHKKWISFSAGEDKSIMVRLAGKDAQSISHSSGRTFRIFTNSLGMKFVYIPPGTFMMGSPKSEKERDDDETQHKVTLTKGFYLGSTEVTVGQFSAFVNETKYRTEAEKGGGAYVLYSGTWQKKKDANWKNPYFQQNDQCPVVYVSWNDAHAFCRWLSKKTGENYRFPTEAEWEYACRAGTTSPFSFGGCLSTDEANYDGNYPYEGCSKGEYRKRTLPVGSFSPNAWGLYDMHGNVWEWCQDKCEWKKKVVTDTYRDAVIDPLCEKGTSRVYRGGSWFYSARNHRSADRDSRWPVIRSGGLGFRLARSE